MSRLHDIITEDSERLADGSVRDWEQIITLKLAQISSTLAMIYDLENERRRMELADDGR